MSTPTITMLSLLVLLCSGTSNNSLVDAFQTSRQTRSVTTKTTRLFSDYLSNLEKARGSELQPDEAFEGGGGGGSTYNYAEPIEPDTSSFTFQQQQQQQQSAPPTAFSGSYLDTLGGSNPMDMNTYSSSPPPYAAHEEQRQQENPYSIAMSSSSYAPPAQQTMEQHQSEPVVMAPPPPQQQQQAQSSVATKAEPIRIQSSPTLSASSPTISITLPVGLAPPKLEKPKDISYGEESRKFRRTVYTHDDWVRHRSPDRFVRNLVSIAASGVYKNMARETVIVTLLSLFVLIYNGCVTGYQDLTGVYHDPIWNSPWLPPLTLPLAAFTLTAPSLSLLLAYRTNAAYQRWDEARKNWGMNINHTRDLVRMGNAFYDMTGSTEEQRQADLQRLSLCTWAFVRSMARHLSPESEDESAFKAELYEKLPKGQAEKIIKAAHRPNRALYDLSMAIENLPMHFLRKLEMHAALTIFEDNLGSSERLLTSPVPLFYNRHTARFLSSWLLLVPFALWEPFGFMWNHIGMLPSMAALTLLLFGIDELATQMDEPFTILPMQAFCDKIGNWCNEIVSWEDGGNGVRTNKSYQGLGVPVEFDGPFDTGMSNNNNPFGGYNPAAERSY